MEICLTLDSFANESIIDYTNNNMFNLQEYFASDIMLRVNKVIILIVNKRLSSF